jgi:hypothetical protein
MPTNENYEEQRDGYWNRKAAEGDGQFAIAVALLEVAKSNQAIATWIKYLGTGDAATPMGAIEYLAHHLGSSIESLGNLGSVADAIGGVADAIDPVMPNKVILRSKKNGEENRR